MPDLSLYGGTCAAHHAPRAYVAAPLFTPEQRAAIDHVVASLHLMGYVSYSPYRDGVMLAPTDPPVKRDEVFYSNKLAIQQSDLLVAILDVKDTGTIWELGMAEGAGIPIIAVTLQVPKMNVMLERGVLAHVTNRDDLEIVLSEMRPHLSYGRKSTNVLRSDEETTRALIKERYTFRGDTE